MSAARMAAGTAGATALALAAELAPGIFRPAPRIAPPPRRVALPARRRRRSVPTTGTRGARALAYVRTLPDHTLIDRLVRGRAWIPVLGVLLAGIVAMQVSLLRLNTSMGRSIEQATYLQTENGLLRAKVASLGSVQRIERVAAGMGLVMTTPEQVTFLGSRSGAIPARAITYMTAPSAAALATTADAAATTSSSTTVGTLSTAAGASTGTSAATPSTPAATSPAPGTAATDPQTPPSPTTASTTAGSTAAGTTAAGSTTAGSTAAGTTAAGSTTAGSTTATVQPTGAAANEPATGGATGAAVTTQPSPGGGASPGTGG